MTNQSKNYRKSPGAGSDNQLIINGTMDITSDSTFKIEGSTVVTTGLAEKLNNLDSVEEVANKSGSPMVAGALVYISGYDTTLDTDIVSLADADDATKKATLVLTEAIADNASGSAESIAIITGLNTDAFSAVGDFVYESATAGEWTQTAPTAADDDRRVVGVIKVKSATIGEISFFPGRAGLEHAAVYLNNLTPGTVSASGAIVVDASLHQDVVHTASLNLGATGATVAVTADAGEINLVDTALAGVVVASKAVVYDASGKVVVSSADVAATGTVIGDAAAMTAQKNVISGANGAAGVKLPVATVDAEVTVINSNASNALLVYPVAGSQINALGAGVAFTVTAGQTATFVARSTTLWNVAAATDTITGLTSTAAELNYNDLTGAIGTAEASKTLVADASIDISGVNVLGATTANFTDIDAGASGTAGSVDVFPTTGSKGKLTLACTDQTGDTAVTINANAMGQATQVNIADPGAAASYVVQSTAALTLAEVDVLDAIVPGTATANGALVVDGSVDIAGINTIGIANITDFVKFLGIQDVVNFDIATGTWTTVRVAQGDYVKQKTATDETAVLGVDITEHLRTTTSRGLQLTSFDVIFRNITTALDAHSVTLDKIAYTDSAVVATTNVALTGALATGTDADPQVSNVTIDTPAFNITDDSKYVMEVTVDAAAGSVYDFIGVMLKFTRNEL